MIVGLLGASGHTGIPTLKEFLKLEGIEQIKVLLERKYKRNKLVLKLAKKHPNKIKVFYGDVANKEDIVIGVALGYEEKSPLNDLRSEKLTIEEACHFFN